MLRRVPVLIVVLAIAFAGWSLWAVRWTVPERFDPWAPLDVAAAPNLLTGYKLHRAQQDRAECLATAGRAGLAFDPVPDRDNGGGCGLTNAIRLRRGATLGLGSAAVLSCGEALAFAMWERHALQPAAREALGEPVETIEHLGSYACRNVNTGGGEGGATSSRRSRHATADALDVAGFVLRDRRRVLVRRDWTGDDATARFLRAAHEGACRYFDGVLGPDYNAVHADHFHLEVGGWRTCR